MNEEASSRAPKSSSTHKEWSKGWLLIHEFVGYERASRTSFHSLSLNSFLHSIPVHSRPNKLAPAKREPANLTFFVRLVCLWRISLDCLDWLGGVKINNISSQFIHPNPNLNKKRLKLGLKLINQMEDRSWTVLCE